MRRKILLVSTIGFIVATGITFGANRVSSQGQSQPPSQAQTQSQSSSSLTPDQIEQIHSQLYSSHVRMLENGKPVEEIPRQLARNSGNIYLQNIPAAEDGLLTGPLTPVERFVCGSDLVIIGTAGTGTTRMTYDKSFPYTDWEIQVQQVLKNSSSAPVHFSSSVIVVTPGGKLIIGNRMVLADDGSLHRLTYGKEYLAFLRLIPATGAYQFWQAYEFSGSAILTVCYVPMYMSIRSEPSDKTTLVGLVANAVNSTSQISSCAGAAKK